MILFAGGACVGLMYQKYEKNINRYMKKAKMAISDISKITNVAEFIKQVEALSKVGIDFSEIIGRVQYE